MDPISLIISAILAGVAAALKPAAEQAVKDAYSGLKTVIQDRYRISLANLEEKPKSEKHLDAIKSDLEESKAAEDKDLLTKAQTLIDAVAKADPGAAQAIGIDLEKVKIEGSILIKRLHAEGGSTGLRAKDVEIKHDLRIDEVETGGGTEIPKR